LKQIGCANQTTMLSKESLEIANMLQEAMVRRFGAEDASERFRHFDTICSATQDRQDAILELTREKLDLMIVVGGYNSSNTGHLVEIALQACPAYHVKDEACILSRDRIQHKKVMSPEVMTTFDWLPKGQVTLGVTAGASTPNRVIEEVSETGGMERKTILLSQIYKYDYELQAIKHVSPSTVYRDRLARESGKTPKDIIDEVYVRSVILKTLAENGMNTMKEITTFCRSYTQNHDRALEALGLSRDTLLKHRR